MMPPVATAVHLSSSDGGPITVTSCRISDFFYLVAIVLLGALLYCNAIHGQFIWDDRAAVVKNEDVHGSSPISSLFVHDFWGQDISSASSHKSYRPLTVLTYRLDFLLYGLDAYGYHITNVVVYCFSCVFFYLAAKLWIDQQAARIAVFLFTIHPIHVEAVTSIVGRADALCGVFYLLAVWSYTLAVRRMDRCCDDPSKDRSYARDHLLLLAGGGGAYVSAVLATLSKEIGFTVLGVFGAIEVLEQMKRLTTTTATTSATAVVERKRRGQIKVIEGVNHPVASNPPHEEHRGTEVFLRAVGACITRGRSLLRVTMLPVAALTYFHLRWVLHGSDTLLYRWSIMENHVLLMPSLKQRTLAYAQYHFWYFWKLLFPSHLCFDYGYKCVRDVECFADPMNLLPLSLYVSLGWYTRRSISRVRVATLMCLAMMVIPIIPALNIFLPVGTLLAERLLFIPSTGFCMLVGQLLAVNLHDFFDRGSSIALHLDTVMGYIQQWCSRSGRNTRQHPHPHPPRSVEHQTELITPPSDKKKKVRFDLRKEKKRVPQKLKQQQLQHYLVKATEGTDPSPIQSAVAGDGPGGDCIHSMMVSPRQGQEATVVRASVSLLHILLALLLVCCGWKIFVRNKDWHDELSLYRSGLDVCPTSLKVLSNYALLSIAHGHTRIGLDAALKAIDIYPEQVAAVTNAGVAYQRLGEFQRSIAMYRRGLQLDPHNNKIYGYLGQAYFAWSNAILTGDFAVRAVRLEALENLMTAVRLGFHAPSMLHMIGTILLDLGRLDEAISYYDSAIRRSAELRSYYRNSKDVPAEDDIDAAGTYNQLGQAFSALANHTMAISMFKEGLKLQPHNIPVISNLGNIYREIGEMDLARQTMRDGIEKSGDAVPAALLNNLGLLELETGRYSEALELFEQALSRHLLSSQLDTSNGSYAKAISPDGNSVVNVMNRNIQRAKSFLTRSQR